MNPGHLITLWVTSPDTHSERRLGSDLTVANLKLKLEPITGIPDANQIIKLQRTKTGGGFNGAGEEGGIDEVIAVLTAGDENRTLESFGVRDWMTIRVDTTDTRKNGSAGEFTDVSRVEKFELTPEEYEKRSDTLLTFKKRNQLGRFAPPSAHLTTQSPPAIPSDLVSGARCEVAMSDEMKRRGTVRFVGPTQFGLKDESVWVGIEWDEPVGKNNGTVDGKRYFSSAPLRASFVRPEKVTVGDFPEIDPFADDNDEMEM